MQVDTSPPVADAWVDIDLDRTRGNLASIQSRLPRGCRYCAVLKADAYGHGIDRVAPVLAQNGVDFAAITDNADVFALRRAGFNGRIMRLRGAAPP